jgi:hypothetical protein
VEGESLASDKYLVTRRVFGNVKDNLLQLGYLAVALLSAEFLGLGKGSGVAARMCKLEHGK